MKTLKDYITEAKRYEISLERWEKFMEELGYKYEPKYDVTVMHLSWHQHRFYVNDKGEYYKVLVDLKTGVKPFEPQPTFKVDEWSIKYGKDINQARDWGSSAIKIDWRSKGWKSLIVK
jgi:hypothetical protein